MPEAHREPADAGLDRPRLHRHGDEGADGQDEEEDRGRPVEETLLPRADRAVTGLDAVQPVGRRVPQLLEAIREGRVDAVLARLRRHLRTRSRLRIGRRRSRLTRRRDDGRDVARRDGRARRQLVVRPGDRRPGRRIRVVPPRGDEEGRDPHEQQDRSQHGERGRELEFLRRRLRRGSTVQSRFGRWRRARRRYPRLRCHA